MRRLRLKRKLFEKNANTRQQHEQVAELKAVQRQKWREQKRKEKEQSTPENLKKMNEKRRRNYIKRQLVKGKIPRTTKNTVYLPSTPSKYVDTVIDLIKKSTPTKKSLFKQYGYLRCRSTIKSIARNARVIALMREKIKNLKKSRNKQDRKNFQLLVSTVSGKKTIDRSLCRSFNVCAKTWEKYTEVDSYDRANRSDAMTQEEQVGIHSFYHTNSTLLGGYKNRIKGKQKMILNVTTQKLHCRFQEVNGKTISLSRFRKERPAYVLCIGKHKFNTCLCEYCINIEHKVQALGKLAKQIDVIMPAKDKYELSDLTVCSYDQIPAPDCLTRTCKKCGTSNLKEAFKDFNKEKTLLWKVWENKKFRPQGKSSTHLSSVTSQESVVDATKSCVVDDTEQEQGKCSGKKMKGQSSNKKGVSRKVLTGKTGDESKLQRSKRKVLPKQELTENSPPAAETIDKKCEASIAQEKGVTPADVSAVKSKGSGVDDTKIGPGKTSGKKEDMSQVKSEKGVSKKVLTEKLSTVSEMIDTLCEEMYTFTEHLATAKWQKAKMRELQESLPDGWVLTIEDYSENFRTCFQDEIQSAHYQYSQVTLYCQVSYFQCPSCPAQVHETAAFVSEDLNHDPHAIHAFHKAYKEDLLDRGVAIEHQVFYSDGCPTQYKAKLPFKHVETSRQILGHSIERCFFGTRHGKSECDGLGGMLKSGARKHVACRNGLIRTADEFYDFCKTEYDKPLDCQKGEHNSRKIFKLHDIPRPEKEEKLVPLPGTRTIHQIKAGDKPGDVLYKTKSCHCSPCRKGEQGCSENTTTCDNEEHTGTWSMHNLNVPDPSLKRKRSHSQKSTTKKLVCPKRGQSVPASLKVKLNKKSSIMKEKTVEDVHMPASTCSLKPRRARSQETRTEKLPCSKRGQSVPVSSLEKANKSSSRIENIIDDAHVPLSKKVKHDPVIERQILTRSKKQHKPDTFIADSSRPTCSMPLMSPMRTRSGLKFEEVGSAQNRCTKTPLISPPCKKRKCDSGSKSVFLESPIPSRTTQILTRQLIHGPWEEKVQKMKDVSMEDVIRREDLSVIGTGAAIDPTGLTLLSDVEVPGEPKMPVCIEPDGNCLPRVGSLLAYGSQEYHADIRFRIARELILHKDEYLSKDYISRGWPPEVQPGPSPDKYAQYSEHYTGQRLTEANVQIIYNKEVNDILKKGSYMGMWQIFALSSVLKCPLWCVYPNKGNPSVRNDLNRLILPRDGVNCPPSFVMWSTCRSDMKDANWVPNHFLALLPVMCCQETAVATATGCITQQYVHIYIKVHVNYLKD
jgi:hypothetical protein